VDYVQPVAQRAKEAIEMSKLDGMDLAAWEKALEKEAARRHRLFLLGKAVGLLIYGIRKLWRRK
jgi:hypothetical protein